MFEVEVIPGRVKIGSIERMIDWPDVKVYFVDLDTKYARPVMQGSVLSDDPAIERLTLELDVDGSRTIDRLTSIMFNVPERESWYLIAEAARYTMFVALFRVDQDGTEVWRAP